MNRSRSKGSEGGVSFEYIFEEYRHSMFGIAYAILHDVHLAEDVTSDCLLRINSIISKLESLSEREVQDYIVTIVKNRSIDEYRKRQKHPEQCIDDHWNLEDTTQSEDTMISHVGYKELVDAIEKLPETHRDILKFRFLYQLSTEEAARLLDINPNAVNQRVHRAKQQLEKILRKEHYFDGK